MDPFLAWLEDTALSAWVRGSAGFFGFEGIIVLHALGMGVVVGLNAAIGLRILGAAPRVPLPALTGVFPVIWLGFALNAFSGVLLLIGYPTKALTNPVFYVKLGCIALGLILMLRIRDTVLSAPGDGLAPPSPRAKLMAAASLFLWAAAITAGRLLAYTHTRLLVDVGA